MKHWISAFRLRTLPLALSSILMGSFLASFYGGFSWLITTLCITTTIFLQVLSNLANDYGDFENGADNDERIGPTRALQSGTVTKSQMKNAIYIFVFLSLTSGISLIYAAFGIKYIYYQLGFLAIGIGAIWAALNYTAGKNPYGYRAMGDLFVFIFFGLVGVIGTFYLQTKMVNDFVWLPAIASGFLATGVLNINNTRDLEPDKKAGKITIPVLIGPGGARIYQLVLIDLSFILLVVFSYLTNDELTKYNFLYLIAYPLFLTIGWGVYRKPAEKLDPYLKKMALGTLILTTMFGLSIVL